MVKKKRRQENALQAAAIERDIAISKRRPPILWVQILEAKPNKMFTEDQRQGILFLRYSRWIPCMECGKKRKVMWTALYEFVAHNLGPFSLQQSGKIHPPLTPVCGDHPIGPPTLSNKEGQHGKQD